MTRLIIFGDLHANWEAWLALQQAERDHSAVLCLGDTVGYGPDPKRCLDSVRAYAAYAIGGAHDRAVASGQPAGDDDVLAETWAHARSVLAPADCNYLAGLPESLSITLGGVRLHMARLRPDDSAAESFSLITAPAAKLRALFAGVEAEIILLGGPHVPAMRQVDGRLIVCPGSLGLPRYGVPDPTFAAWQDGRVQIHHLHYHPDTTIQKMSLLPLAPESRLRLQAVLQTGGRHER